MAATQDAGQHQTMESRSPQEDAVELIQHLIGEINSRAEFYGLQNCFGHTFCSSWARRQEAVTHPCVQRFEDNDFHRSGSSSNLCTQGCVTASCRRTQGYFD